MSRVRLRSNHASVGEAERASNFLIALSTGLLVSCLLALIGGILLSSYFAIEASEMMFGVSWDAPYRIAQHGVEAFEPLRGPNDCDRPVFQYGVADCSFHWFGDLASGVEIARTADPWANLVSNPYFPVAVGYYKLLGLIPSTFAIVVHAALTLAAASFVAWRIVRIAFDGPRLKWLVGATLVLASQPVVYAIDRGNIHLLCIALLAAAGECLMRFRGTAFHHDNAVEVRERAGRLSPSRRRQVAIFVACNTLAVSMKPTLAIVVLAYILLFPGRKRTILFFHGLAFLCINLAVLFTFSARLDRILWSIVLNLQGYAEPSDANVTMWRSSSLSGFLASVGFVLRIDWLLDLAVRGSMLLTLLVLCLFGFPTFFAFRRRIRTPWIITMGPILITHFLLPRAYTYSLSVALLVALFFIWELRFGPEDDRAPNGDISRVVALGILCMLFYDPPIALEGPSNLVPSVFLNNFVSPLGIFLLIFSAAYEVVRVSRLEATLTKSGAHGV